MTQLDNPETYSRLKWWWRFFAIVTVSSCLFFSLTLYVNHYINTPRLHAQSGNIISVSQGTSVRQILNQLTTAGILSDSFIMQTWFKLKASQNSLKAGDYVFVSPISPSAVVSKLIRGEVYFNTLTIPEGLGRIEISNLIQNINVKDSDHTVQLTEAPQLLQLIKDIDPQATTLEGYLFPDTYKYTKTTTSTDLITTMVKRFRQVYTSEYQQRERELNMTTRQIVTLASMIETEAQLTTDRPVISSVYHNRLKIGMNLACDPTIIYASKLAGQWSGIIKQSDLKRESPYNTYRFRGLPPGPIASPGRASLEAALNPADTTYLYFVVDATRNDGSHIFSDNAKEHESNVALYRLAQRRARGVVEHEQE